MSLNERKIQLRLWHWRSGHGHKYICPNSRLFYGEADLLSVSKADYSFCHEIKVSRQDFLNEINGTTRSKELWHEHLADAKNLQPKDRFYFSGTKLIPNYFMFVCPEGLIKKEEVPEYAGLIYCKEINLDIINNLNIIKRPKRLHTDKVCSLMKEKIATSLMWRFWRNIEKSYVQKKL